MKPHELKKAHPKLSVDEFKALRLHAAGIAIPDDHIERLVTLGHLTPRLGGHQVTDVGNVRLMMGPDA